MLARLERILHKLVQQYAPSLQGILSNPQDDLTLRLQKVARKLADYQIMVVLGDIPQEIMSMRDVHIQDWIRGYGQMYSLLAQGLFPSNSQINAHYADDRLPPVVVLNGQAIPVMNVMSGYINPYVALRQPQEPYVTELELRAMMDIILEELEAGDIARPHYEQLRETGVIYLQQMLRASVRHVSLTTFDKPVLKAIQVPAPPPKQAPPRPQGNLPEQSAQKLKLELLKEDDKPDTPTERMFTRGITMPRPNGRRRPPVPLLPKKDDDKKNGK